MTHKVIIIGSGPAGLTAGIYTGRSKLEPLIIDGKQPGGQLMTTTFVENWPGVTKDTGPKIMADMRAHAEAYGSTFLGDQVSKVDLSSTPYKVHTEGGKVLETQTIIVASGASHKKLGVPGEEEYWGKGITTCATCDAPFYTDKEVVVVGGGNTAVTEASFLTRFTKKITIVQIEESLSANDPIKDDVLGDPDIKFLYNSTIKEMKGDGKHLKELVIENVKTKETQTIPANGLFVAIGFKPNTDMFKGELEMDKFGYLKLHDQTRTSKDGVFAAGDVADYRYMQAVTAAGFGCMAALDCEQFIRSKK